MDYKYCPCGSRISNSDNEEKCWGCSRHVNLGLLDSLPHFTSTRNHTEWGPTRYCSNCGSSISIQRESHCWSCGERVTVENTMETFIGRFHSPQSGGAN